MKQLNSLEKAVSNQRHPKKKVKFWEAWTKFGTPVCIDHNTSRGILYSKFGDSANYKGIY